MENENRIVIATTTLNTDKTTYEKIRADLALKTIIEAKSHHFNVLIVDGGSSSVYVDRMIELGADVVSQEESGMGNARRQSLRLAREISDKHEAIVWLEPEKYTLIPFIAKVADKIIYHNNDMAMFRRRSLKSYPPEQEYTYKMVALAFKYLTNIESDFLFGPVALSRGAVDYFLSYKSKYGDVWDSIHIPKLHIIYDQLPWTQVTVDYKHPQEQTTAEQGNMSLFVKRVEQIRVITQALINEIAELRKKDFETNQNTNKFNHFYTL